MTRSPPSCLHLCRKGLELKDNLGDQGSTIAVEMDFALWTLENVVFTMGRSLT